MAKRKTPANPRRKAIEMTDEDGSKHTCRNGDILGDIFHKAPAYARETPPVEVTPDGIKIGYSVNKERITRFFGDFQTALDNAELIWGWKSGEVAELKNFLNARGQEQLGAIRASDALFEEVDREINLDTLRPQFTNSVCGGAPRVGAFLAGQPDSMLRQTSVLDAQGAIRVFVDLSTSASTSHHARTGRSAAILALVRCIQQVRPVELWVTTSGTCGTMPRNHTLFGLRVSAAPFDLTQASFALCHPSMRSFLYKGEMRLVGAPLGTNAHLSWSPIPYATKAGANDNDICIGPHRDNLKNSIKADVSPVAWVKRELELWLTRSGQSAALAAMQAS